MATIQGMPAAYGSTSGYASTGGATQARPEGVYDVANRVAERLTKVAELLDALVKRVNGEVPRETPADAIPGPMPLFGLIQRIDVQANQIENVLLGINAAIGV